MGVGFNYKFDALVGEPNELNQAFSTIFQASTKFEVFPLLQAFFPPFRLIVRVSCPDILPLVDRPCVHAENAERPTD